MEEGVTARPQHREGHAVHRRERQDHRHDREHEGRRHADERVRRAHGTALHLAGLVDDSVLELVERRVRGRTELLCRSPKLLSSRRALLSTRGSVRGLLTGRRIPLRTALSGVRGLLARLRTVLRLAVALRSTGGLGRVLAVSGGLRCSVFLGSNLGHGTLTGSFHDRALEILVRDRRGHIRRSLRHGCHLGRLVDRLGLNDRLNILNHGSSLSLRSTPPIGLHRLGLGNQLRLNDRLNILNHGSSLGLRSTPRIGLHRLSLHGRRLTSGSILRRRLSDLRAEGVGGLHGRGGGSGLSHGGLRGNDTSVSQPLGKRRVQRRVRRHIRMQIRTSGGDIGEILCCQRRIAHVCSGELRQINSAHLNSSRTRRRSS